MEDIEHQDDDNWLSNVRWPATVEPEPETTSKLELPEYNPAILLEYAVEALARVNIRVDLTNRRQVAVTAAADLLRALGVQPANAPRRP